MSTLLIFVTTLIFQTFNVLLWRQFKKTAQAICCIILTVPTVLNLVLLILSLQFEPVFLLAEVMIILICEFIFLSASAKELRLVGFAVITLCLIGVMIFQSSAVVKEFNDKEYVGLYQKNTGFGETKVTYYEKKAFPFISSEIFCVENYGVVLGAFDVENSTPYSVEYSGKQ